MLKIKRLTLLYVCLSFQLSFQAYAQSDCKGLLKSLEKLDRKHEKWGAFTVISKSDTRSPSMRSSDAFYKGQMLMVEEINAYMQAYLSPELTFENDEQKQRFDTRVMGKSTPETMVVGNNVYQGEGNYINLTLIGMRRIMSADCIVGEGNITQQFQLIALPPEGIMKTIDETIKEFIDQDPSSGRELMNSWQQSSLRVELLEKQKTYDKKMK